jgi:hypothetical protein
MKILNRILGILFFVEVIGSCSENGSSIYDENLVFTHAIQIKIPEYTYRDFIGNLYYVRGDTSYFSIIIDTLNNTPVFEWDSIGIGIITMAIFSHAIIVDGNEIRNTADIVWQWHSGMKNGKSREGFVQYSDGRNVLHDTSYTIDYENPATPLDAGYYYWAIWGWNGSGTMVWFSSRQLEFYVSN